jgi:hypothetical protein
LVAILLRKLFAKLRFAVPQQLSFLNHAAILIAGYHSVYASMSVFVKLFSFIFQF